MDTEKGESLLKDLRSAQKYDTRKLRTYHTEEQNGLIDQLLAAVKPLLDEDHLKSWCTEATSCRYLRARQWDLHKAEKMLTGTIAWRKEFKPHAIKADHVKSEFDNKGKLYHNGFDLNGRPILLMKPGHDNTGSGEREMKIRHLVYMLESVVMAAHSNYHEKITLLIDFKNNDNMAGVATMKTNLAVLNILQDHYPETLGQGLMVNHPWSFSFFWGMISPFLDPVTKAKVVMVKKHQKFAEYVAADQLEKEYGGENPFEYDFETHYDKEDVLYRTPKKVEEVAGEGKGSSKGGKGKKKGKRRRNR